MAPSVSDSGAAAVDALTASSERLNQSLSNAQGPSEAIASRCTAAAARLVSARVALAAEKAESESLQTTHMSDATAIPLLS